MSEGLDVYPDRKMLGQVFKDPRMLRAIEQLFLNAGGLGSTFNPGDFKASGAATDQAGWLICDGSQVSRTQYPDLFAAIGETWGAGDGSSTFHKPDLRGRALIGYDGTHALGTYGGAADVALTTAQLPPHSHGVDDPGHTHTFAGAAHTHAFTGIAHTHSVTDPGHTHGVTDPGHDHTSLEAASTNTTGTDPDSAVAGNTGSATTGITVDAATTGITNANTTAGGTNANTTATGTNAPATTGITTEDTGSGAPIDVQSPYAAVAWFIKT